MHALFESYFDRLQAMHQQFIDAIEDVPQEGLDWVPGADMNSMVVLVVHTAGSQRYWVGDVVGGDYSARNRDAEFAAKGLDFEALKTCLMDVEAHTHKTLEALTLETLSEMRPSWRDDNDPYNVAWALQHALWHTGLHLGHLQITRQLWDQRG